MDIENISPVVVKFELGELVDIVPRFWPGINKAGGTARVREVCAGNKYSVTYVLGGREDNVDAQYILKKSNNDGEHKASRKRTQVQTLQVEIFHKPTTKKKQIEDRSATKKNEPEDVRKNLSLQKKLSIKSCKRPAVLSIIETESPSTEEVSSCGDNESLAETEGETMDISQIALEILQNLLPAINSCSPLACGGYLAMDILNYFMAAMEGCESDDIEMALSAAEADNKVMIIDDEENGRVIHVI